VEQQVVREVAPAKLPQEGLGGVLGQIAGRDSVARRPPDLARRDLAPVQVRREARGAGAVGAVAFGLVTGRRAVEERREPRRCAALAGCPGGAQSGGPVGPYRQEIPGVEVVAGDVVEALQLFRWGERRRRIAGRLQGPPERREDFVGRARAGLQLPGFDEEAGIVGGDLETVVGELLLQPLVARHRLRLVAAVPEHRAGTDAPRQLGQNLLGHAAAQAERRPEPPQVAGECLEAVMQPPARRAAGCRILRRIEDEQRQ
jgi:hypothetical protein